MSRGDTAATVATGCARRMATAKRSRVSTESAHREAGRLAASLGIDALYAVGSHAPLMAEGAQTAGMSPERVFADVDWEAIGARVVSDLRADDRVLVKGSRAMRMERIVKLITQASGSSA